MVPISWLLTWDGTACATWPVLNMCGSWWARLQRSFPALRSFDGRRGRLPPQPTSFIGRRTELGEVVAALREHRLVSVVGPGGVGKTRLAVQVGLESVDAFPDGVWMCELAALDTAAGMDAAVLSALGLQATAVMDLRAHLLDVVSTWRALLLVDNCEHLLGEATDLVLAVMAAAPNISVLATSREPLHVPAEKVMTLRPLEAVEEAVPLFIDRATSLRQAFDLDDESRSAVTQICQQLDGLPLAIELAAARTIAMSPQEIARHLDQRFRLLAERFSDPGSRHGSLRRLVQWSYDLLDPPTQLFFARLSVFSGAFDVAAAREVCELDDELTTLDMLTELVDKSLATANPVGSRTSYRLLETMRQYGAAQLGDDDTVRLRRQHSTYYADFCERSWAGIRGDSSQQWFDHIDDEFANIRTASERALGEGDVDTAIRIVGGLFMYNHSRRLPEVWGWLHRALDLPGGAERPLGRHALLHRSAASWMTDDVADAEASARKVLGNSDGGQDPLLPLALYLLSSPCWALGRLDEGLRHNRRALELARAWGPDFNYDAGLAMWNASTLSVALGSPDPQMARQLLDLGRRTGHSRTYAQGLMQVGITEPDTARAISLLADARDLTARSRDTYAHLNATAWLTVVQATENPRAVIEAIPQILDQARATGQHIIVRMWARDVIDPLATLGRLDVVPVPDAVTSANCIRPARAADAVARARDHFGDEEYQRRKDEAATKSTPEIEQYLLEVCAELRSHE